MTPRLSVILPANNEESFIGDCLSALFDSETVPGGSEVIVVANGCHDRTAAAAQDFAGTAAAKGWGLTVLDLPQGGKMGALNAGDDAAKGTIRAYLDADVIVSPPLMAQIAQALAAANDPAYAGGRPVVSRAKSIVTRAYARLWQRLPFARGKAPGFGIFAVNTAGRARWGKFPDIISDDTFVRLNFTDAERIEVPATYEWPMVEGFSRLVAVRRRQDAGVAQIAERWPHLMGNEGKEQLTPGALGRLALTDPVGFVVYAAVSVAVRAGRSDGGWTRGR